MTDTLHINHKQITSNKLLDNLLVNFPLWFPIVYIFLALNFPSFSKILFISSLFLFAETHFASTWLFFFDKENWSWVRLNFYKVVFIPSYILILTIIAWFFSPSFIILTHYIASGWHVTRQSAGIMKLYGVKTKIYTWIVYFVSFLCLSIGIKQPGLLASTINIGAINILIGISFIIYLLILYLNKLGRLSNILVNSLPVLTGIFIYLPILFFKDLYTATAIGVGMHWCQYMALTFSYYFRKKNSLSTHQNYSSNSNSSRLLFIVFYSLLMTTLAVIGMPNINTENSQYSFLYLIPLLFQFYHFYVDGYIWKFSDPHIKQSVLRYLYFPSKSKIN